MKTLVLKKKELNLKEFIKRSALEGDYKTLFKEPTIIVDADTGQPVIIYDYLRDFDTAPVVDSLKRIEYHQGKRTRGLVSTSRIFGYRPRSEIRGDFCSSTSMANEFPTEHSLVANLALKLEEYYQSLNPEGHLRHKTLAEKALPSYRIQGKSVFTSGIINKNNPLKYHFDAGNFNDVYSCMIVFKGGIGGGYLSCPEYDVAFQLPNNSVFFFDGQGILHGVTPIRRQNEQSYRFSVVYYSLKRMWQCLTVDDELARVRKVKTTRERTRMKNPLTQEDRDRKEKNRKMLDARYGKQ